MFFILAIILFVIWGAGLLFFKAVGILIHLLLLFAVLSLIMHVISGRRAV